MEQTGIFNQGGGKIEYVDPSKITAGQKFKTGLVFIYPATPNAIDDVDALFTGWIVFNENVNRWQEAGREPLKGNWNASSGTLPSNNVIAGNKYIISVGGVVNGISLKENDAIIAKIDNPTDSQTNNIFDDWTVVGAITVTSDNVGRPNGDSVETGLVDLETNKVDKVVNKQLSTEDYTTTEKNKLAGIEQNATADQSDLEIKTAYENNANTNAFTDAEKTNLSNQSNTNTGDETTSSIQSKRPLKTVEGQSLEGAGNIDLVKADVGLNNVDNTSDADKPVSTAQQTALDSKLAKASNLSDLSNRQAALDILTNAASATDEYVLTKDTATGNTIFKALPTSNVVDNLTSTSTTSALSANQGRILNNTKEPVFSKNTAFNKNFGTSSGTVTQGNDSRLPVKRLEVLIGQSQTQKKGINFSYGQTINNPFFQLSLESGSNNDSFTVKVIDITSTGAKLEVYRADANSWGDTLLSCFVTIYEGTY